MRVAYVEPDCEGHHLALYSRAALIEMHRRGYEVHFFTTERARNHPAFLQIPEAVRDALIVHEIADVPRADRQGAIDQAKGQMARWDAWKAGFSRANVTVDVMMLNNLDQIDLPYALKGSPFGEIPIVAILIGRHFHLAEPSLKERIYEWIFRANLKQKSLRQLLVVDQTLHLWADKHKVVQHQKVAYLPDQGEVESAPHVHFQELAGKKLLLLYGSLTPRKGIEQALDGLLHESCPKDWCAFLVGRQDEAIQQLVVGPKGQRLKHEHRLFEFNGFASSEVEADAFDMCTAVWLGYINWPGSSGVQYQAAAANRPIVSMREGNIGHLTVKNHLGEAVEQCDPQQVAEALGRLAESKSYQDGHLLEFAKRHTSEAFGTLICNTLENAISR